MLQCVVVDGIFSNVSLLELCWVWEEKTALFWYGKACCSFIVLTWSPLCLSSLWLSLSLSVCVCEPVPRISISTYTKLCSASSAPRRASRVLWPGTLMGPWRPCQTSPTRQRAWSHWSERPFRGQSWVEGVLWVQTPCELPEPMKEALNFVNRQGTIVDKTFWGLFCQTLG